MDAFYEDHPEDLCYISSLQPYTVDVLPQQLCFPCFKKCQEWNLFRIMCHDNEQTLINAIVSSEDSTDIRNHQFGTSTQPLFNLPPIKTEPIDEVECEDPKPLKTKYKDQDEQPFSVPAKKQKVIPGETESSDDQEDDKSSYDEEDSEDASETEIDSETETESNKKPKVALSGNYSCAKCGKIYSYVKSFRRHKSRCQGSAKEGNSSTFAQSQSNTRTSKAPAQKKKHWKQRTPVKTPAKVAVAQQTPSQRTPEIMHHCRKCSKYFNLRKALTSHLWQCNGQLCCCPYCGLEMPSQLALSSHLSQFHPNGVGVRILRLGLMGKLQSKKSIGQTNDDAVEERKPSPAVQEELKDDSMEQKLNCPHCPRHFINGKTLDTHVFKFHRPLVEKERKKRDNVGTCKICDKEVRHLADHEKAHSLFEANMHVCPEPWCGQRFHGLKKLAAHQQHFHSEGKPAVEKEGETIVVADVNETEQVMNEMVAEAESDCGQEARKKCEELDRLEKQLEQLHQEEEKLQVKDIILIDDDEQMKCFETLDM